MAIPPISASDYFHKYWSKFHNSSWNLIYSLRTTCTYLDLEIWVSGCKANWLRCFHTWITIHSTPTSNYLCQYWLKFYDLIWRMIYSLRTTCTYLDLEIWVSNCEDNWVRFFHSLMAIHPTPASNYLYQYWLKFHDLTRSMFYLSRATCTHLDHQIWVSGCKDKWVRFFYILIEIPPLPASNYLCQYWLKFHNLTLSRIYI